MQYVNTDRTAYTDIRGGYFTKTTTNGSTGKTQTSIGVTSGNDTQIIQFNFSSMGELNKILNAGGYQAIKNEETGRLEIVRQQSDDKQ